MIRKSLAIGKLILSYIEQNSAGARTVFFFHGNSNSARLWYKQLQDLRFQEYRIIAFDLPAHGQSSEADSDAIYNVKGMGKLMATAVNHISQKDKYILVGLSLGSNIVAEMLAFNLCPAALVLIGPSLVGAGITPEDVIKDSLTAEALFTDKAKTKSVKKYLAKASISKDELDQKLLLEDYYLVKQPFRTSFSNSIAAGIYSDEVTLIRKKNLPLLIIWGEKDVTTLPNLLEKAGFTLWGNNFFKIKQAGHLVNLDKPQQFNELLENFLQDTFK